MARRVALVLVTLVLMAAGVVAIHERSRWLGRVLPPLWSTQDVVPASASNGGAPNWVAVVDAVRGAVVHVQVDRVPRDDARAHGSGFVVNPAGYIVTTARVVEGADHVWVGLVDGRRLPGTVIGRDARVGVALLKVDAENLPLIPLAEPSTVRVGESVLAVGNPARGAQFVTAGIVSAFQPDGGDRVIRTTAPIEPGTSGGPVVDPRGHAIGMTVDRSEARAAIGGASAIPIGSVQTVLQRLAPPPSSTLADTLGRRLHQVGEPRVLRP